MNISIQDLERLADQGNIEAQIALGGIYHTGESVARDDRKALQWWLKAAK